MHNTIRFLAVHYKYLVLEYLHSEYNGTRGTSTIIAEERTESCLFKI